MLLLVACAPSDPAGGKDTPTGTEPTGEVDSDTSGTTDSDSGETADTTHTGGGDTTETADTEDTTDPDLFTATVYAVPEATWYGLSVANDGAVWGATSVGLVRFDPATAMVSTWTSADGLTTDTPTAVLAASDSTVWVGHVFDDTRQGEQVFLDGATLAVLQPIDFTGSTEITSLFRIREQPWGEGVGDVWMGSNEGLNVWDDDLRTFDEHAHPTHPHGDSAGVAFSPDGHVWNLDENQLSRWNYSNDGDLSSSADLVEFWPPWPVELEEPIYGTDMDADAWRLWLASSLFGVAAVDVGVDVGTSVTSYFDEMGGADAVRVGPDGTVWVGGVNGLFRYDGAGFVLEERAPAGAVSQLAAGSDGVWAVIGLDLVALRGAP